MINSIGNTNCQVEELKYTGYPSDIINSIKIRICHLNVCNPSFPGSDKNSHLGLQLSHFLDVEGFLRER